MKRLGSSDSLGGLMSICPNSTDENNNPIYTRDFQTMLEGLDEEACCIEESGHVSEKKRRLSVDQVKALEKNFEVENKLEPERKVKLAQELGLQPRQVAVWFQNRRARWKTKQLERDYGILKANYDGLKLNFEKLQHDNEALLKEIQELKSSLNEDGSSESKLSDTEEKSKLEDAKCDEVKELNFQGFNCNNNGEIKDGSSDSDSSAIWNEDHNNTNKVPVNISFQFSANGAREADNNYQPQLVKIEEHNFFGEESCSTFFSDDQAPTLHWYTSDEWN